MTRTESLSRMIAQIDAKNYTTDDKNEVLRLVANALDQSYSNELLDKGSSVASNLQEAYNEDQLALKQWAQDRGLTYTVRTSFI